MNACTIKEDMANMIVPNLWLGDVKSSNDFNFLNNKDINHVIRLIEYIDFDVNNIEETRGKNLNKTSFGYIYTIKGVTYYHFPIRDEDMCKKNIVNFFKITNFILSGIIKRGKNVLVHCKKGHHRSASVVGAYLLKRFNLNYENVISFINSYRGCALRRDTCLGKGLYKYYLYLNNKTCDKIMCQKRDRINLCMCKD